MADAFRKFSTTVVTSQLATVKESKSYKSMAGMKIPDVGTLTGTWEEFCNLLGISDEKANQDIKNLRAFGEEALESMSRMGIGYRELRQFRALPADERTALAELAQSSDKEAVLDLALASVCAMDCLQQMRRRRRFWSIAWATRLPPKTDRAVRFGRPANDRNGHHIRFEQR